VARFFLPVWKNPIKNQFMTPAKNQIPTKIFYPVISYGGITPATINGSGLQGGDPLSEWRKNWRAYLPA
jgi:hypothetical protein